MNLTVDDKGNRFGGPISPKNASGGFDAQSMHSSPAVGGQGGSDNTAHLKGKLNNLNDTVRQLQEQLNTHKKEV